MEFLETKKSFILSKIYRTYFENKMLKTSNFFSSTPAILAINIDPEGVSRKIKQFWKRDGHRNSVLK